MVEILKNPLILRAVACQELKDVAVEVLAKGLMSAKSWEEMAANEQRDCIRYIVGQVESRDELKLRLEDDLNLYSSEIDWSDPVPGDKTDEEARMLIKAMGGLVAKNGATVTIWHYGELFS